MTAKIQALRDLLDLLQSDGGHVLVALVLLFSGLFCLAHWKIAEGKDLFTFALGILAYAMKQTVSKNG